MFSQKYYSWVLQSWSFVVCRKTIESNGSVFGNRALHTFTPLLLKSLNLICTHNFLGFFLSYRYLEAWKGKNGVSFKLGQFCTKGLNTSKKLQRRSIVTSKKMKGKAMQ